MKYLLLIYGAEAHEAQMSEAEMGELFGRYGAFSHELVEAGAMVAGEALEPTQQARSVRVRNGATMVSDGPFAETVEQLGGFYLVEAATPEEAIAWAAKIPSAEYGTVEVRPVMSLPEPG